MALVRFGHVVNPGIFAFAISSLSFCGPAFAAGAITGRVLGAGAPIANSTVTLWSATTGNPQQLAQTNSAADGRWLGSNPAICRAS